VGAVNQTPAQRACQHWVEIDEILTELELLDARAANVVEMRFFWRDE
jgi:hypothetical protein